MTEEGAGESRGQTDLAAETGLVRRGGELPQPGALRALVFDFDGVILESAEIKTDAFRELFRDHPQHEAAILDYHLDHLGVSRYEKFHWIYANLLERPLDEEENERLGEAYGAIVRRKVLACPFVPGAPELLRASAPHRPAFVASGTPQDELRWIVRQRGLTPFFEEVWGSPRSKEEILLDIRARWKLEPGQMLMIGDGLTDYEAALATGTPFVARLTDCMRSRWSGLEVVRVRDLNELAELLDLRAAGSGAE